MTSLILIGSTILLILVLIGLYYLSSYLTKKHFTKSTDEFNTQPNKFVVLLVLLCVLLLAITGFLPFILTREAFTTDFDFKETGTIGDTIGGIAGPFINLVAVFVTGLAFYMQYKANKLQVSLVSKQIQEAKNQFKDEQLDQEKQYKKSQFESQFFELLSLHKENVNELSTINFLGSKNKGSFQNLSNKPVHGRQVFFEMNKLFVSLLNKVKFDQKIDMNENQFDDAYRIFFWGIKEKGNVNVEFGNSLLSNSSFMEHTFETFDDYNGVSFYLGHYFRHLFLTVKFVVEHEVITDYKDKMKYLKILRAQLSNHEQIMLFYNWISGYGLEWEDKNNSFLTEYKMIHNLWCDELFQDQFIVDALNELIDKYNENNEGADYKPLFEFQGDKVDRMYYL